MTADEELARIHSPSLVEQRRTHLQTAVGDLGALVIAALRRSVDCLRRQDLGLGRSIIEDAALAVTGTYLLWIAHNHELVADRATNVAERAIYVACGSTPDLN